MSRVKRRQAPGKGTVPYLEGHDIIDRANQIFDFGWSFELIREPVIVRWQKKVLIWNQQEKRKIPSLDANGNVQTEEVGIVYIIGKVTVELDEKIISHSDLGRCIFTGDTPEALDMALAGSATDCLKRCFRQMGDQFGNLLYDKEITQNTGLEKNKPNNMTSSQNTPPSTSKVERIYVDGVRVNGNISEQEAFDQFKEKNGKAPASRNELRTWLAAQHTQTAPATVAA
jgi:recombination DNA repair RAD52 pathway protein